LLQKFTKCEQMHRGDKVDRRTKSKTIWI
jgi:hypothetical protein